VNDRSGGRLRTASVKLAPDFNLWMPVCHQAGRRSGFQFGKSRLNNIN
jgi:hypothetical protein